MECENHDRNTRFANNMNVVVPKPNVETFRNSFMYQDAISWNSLPPQLYIRKSIFMHPHGFIVQTGPHITA